MIRNEDIRDKVEVVRTCGGDANAPVNGCEENGCGESEER